jgi:site-specific DNA recombinase
MNAVIYLRVSTKDQAERDADPEGYSIPAQREACRRKAAMLGADVVEEYVDLGESAKTADRPALQRMLERLKAHDIDYVIVHKIDRLARSRADDVTIGLALRAAGVKLASVTENIDDSPSGKLLHGIMASIAEFYSQNLASEILKGSTQKAKAGGTPHMAPIGYLNVREVVDGREVRTIQLDPERAPLVAWAFETYATGQWSLNELLDELTDRGLTNRPGGKRPERPLHLSKLHRMLRDPYYLGIVSYRGMQYEGRHQALVTPEVFDQVGRVLAAHKQSGERYRRYEHYLKGTVFCARCKSRLSLSRSRGNGGAYIYFFCLGRHTRRTDCTLPYMRPEDLEAAVERYWHRVQLDAEFVEQVRADLLAELQRDSGQVERRLRQVRSRIAQIEHRRGLWAEKVVNGSVPDDIGRGKQNELTGQLVRARQDLAELEAASADITETLNEALDLVSNCAAAYQSATPALRREWNQAFFERIEIDVESEAGVSSAKLKPPFDLLVASQRVALYQRPKSVRPSPRRHTAPRAGSRMVESDRTFVGVGSNKNLLVEVRGFEPLTSSVRVISGPPPCRPAFPQVAADRQGPSYVARRRAAERDRWAPTPRRRSHEGELRHDGSVVGFGELHIGPERARLIGQVLVVDLGVLQGGQQRPGGEHVIDHLASAQVEQRVPGRGGHLVLAGHHDPWAVVGVAGVLDLTADRL